MRTAAALTAAATGISLEYPATKVAYQLAPASTSSRAVWK
jgi:hypothetical protein